MDELLNILAELIKQYWWIAPVLSLFAGIVTSFTPCSLSSVPMVIAYIGGTSGSDTKKAFRLSLTMAFGMAVTFGALGSIVSVIGHLMHEAGKWWFGALGIIMILMALQTWEVISVVPHVHHDHCMSPTVGKKGYFGAFAAGVLSGLFASHCATPVMIALLAIAARSGRALWGIFLIIIYAVGHSILIVLAGTSYSVVESWMNNPKYEKASRILRYILGGIIMLIGAGMLYMAFFHVE